MHHRSYQSILPTHNKLLQKRWDDTYFQEHRRRIKTANPMVSTDAPKVHPHVFNKLKKQQRESERLEVVQRDNHTLMLHMENIMHKGSYVDHQNKYDHWSLNYHKRANELQRIQTENIKMLGRIQSRPPNYCVSEWVKDRNEKERLLRMITTHPTQKTHSPRQSAKEKDLQYLPPLAPQTNEKSSSLDIKVSDTDTINSLERDLEIANKNIPQVSKGDIEEMKTFNKPPVVVKSVLEANSILFTHNVQPYSRFSKTVRDFQSFDKDRIPYSVLEKLEPYIDNPELNSDRIKCVSASAVGVMEWIRSIYQYGIITHKLKQLGVNPKQKPAQQTYSKDSQSFPPLIPPAKKKISSLNIEVSDTDTINSLGRDLEIANKNIPQVSKGDIEEMKTFNKPPAVVKYVRDANSILFTRNVQPYTPRFSKTVRDFQSFDKDRIPYSVLEKLEPYIDNPELNSDRIKCVSASAVGLMEWIRSIYQYGIITHKLKQLNANAEQRDTTSEMVPSN